MCAIVSHNALRESEVLQRCNGQIGGRQAGKKKRFDSHLRNLGGVRNGKGRSAASPSLLTAAGGINATARL